jgi:hypothetical protein
VINLELERLDIARLEFGLRVDGADAAGLLESLELSVWYGHVVGRGDSEAAFSFSLAGANGWVRVGEHLDHFLSGGGRVWAVSEQRRLPLGRRGRAELREHGLAGRQRLAPRCVDDARPRE